MKQATCKQLKGACDAVIVGSTPEEMGENSRKHVMEMLAKGDQAHKDAVAAMQQLSQDEQHAWYAEFSRNFDSLNDA